MSVSFDASLDAPIAEVWALVSDFAGLKRWHPLVVRCETQGFGEGAVRTVHFADWWATERLDRLDQENHVVGYSVIDSARAPTIGVKGTITLTKLEERRTNIAWSSGLPPENPYAEAVNTGLQAYYPARLAHLRDALNLPQA